MPSRPDSVSPWWVPGQEVIAHFIGDTRWCTIETQKKPWAWSTLENVFITSFLWINNWHKPLHPSQSHRNLTISSAMLNNHPNTSFQDQPVPADPRRIGQNGGAPAAAAGFLCQLENSRRSGGSWDTHGWRTLLFYVGGTFISTPVQFCWSRAQLCGNKKHESTGPTHKEGTGWWCKATKIYAAKNFYGFLFHTSSVWMQARVGLNTNPSFGSLWLILEKNTNRTFSIRNPT